MVYSITRDNASSNDTLIQEFTTSCDMNGIKFKGDIPCAAHVLNLVVQRIIKCLIVEDNSVYGSDYEASEADRIENDIKDNADNSGNNLYAV